MNLRIGFQPNLILHSSHTPLQTGERDGYKDVAVRTHMVILGVFLLITGIFTFYGIVILCHEFSNPLAGRVRNYRDNAEGLNRSSDLQKVQDKQVEYKKLDLDEWYDVEETELVDDSAGKVFRTIVKLRDRKMLGQEALGAWVDYLKSQGAQCIYEDAFLYDSKQSEPRIKIAQAVDKANSSNQILFLPMVLKGGGIREDHVILMSYDPQNQEFTYFDPKKGTRKDKRIIRGTGGLVLSDLFDIEKVVKNVRAPQTFLDIKNCGVYVMQEMLDLVGMADDSLSDEISASALRENFSSRLVDYEQLRQEGSEPFDLSYQLELAENPETMEIGNFANVEAKEIHTYIQEVQTEKNFIYDGCFLVSDFVANPGKRIKEAIEKGKEGRKSVVIPFALQANDQVREDGFALLLYQPGEFGSLGLVRYYSPENRNFEEENRIVFGTKREMSELILEAQTGVFPNRGLSAFFKTGHSKDLIIKRIRDLKIPDQEAERSQAVPLDWSWYTPIVFPDDVVQYFKNESWSKPKP